MNDFARRINRTNEEIRDLKTSASLASRIRCYSKSFLVKGDGVGVNDVGQYTYRITYEAGENAIITLSDDPIRTFMQSPTGDSQLVLINPAFIDVTVTLYSTRPIVAVTQVL